MSAGYAPARTCVGCRQRGLRSELVRLVQDHASTVTAVVVDPAASAPGRGCWVHPHHGCLDRAVHRRAIPRALRLSASVDLDAVTQWFARNVSTDR